MDNGGYGDLGLSSSDLQELVYWRDGFSDEVVVPTNGQTSVILPSLSLTSVGVLVSASAGPVSATCAFETRVTMPYVSSTNVAYAPHLPPGYDTASQLKITIGDAETISGSWSALQSRVIRFSSTHFSHLQPIVIVIEATVPVNGQDVQRIHREALIAYNVFAVTQDPDFLTGQPAGLNGQDLLQDVFRPGMSGQAQETLKKVSLSNHLLDPPQGASTAEGLLASFSRCTALHYSLHGASDGSRMGFRGGQAIDRQMVLNYLGRRSWRPPINVVAAASCWSGKNPPTSILGSFFGGAGPGVNQAALGFHECSWIIGLQGASRVFWTVLASGKTAEDARTEAQATYRSEKPRGKRSVPGLKADLSKLELRGDGKAKLWGLYAVPQKETWIKLELLP